MADGRERRAFPRQTVDSAVIVSLLNVGGQLRGQLLDLSLSGCRVRTDERSAVNAKTRVNVELLLDGVLFRLDGVIEGNEDQRNLRIRFQDMSGHQREKLARLMKDMQTLHLEEPGDSW
jgi:c-di-GMP-binding flagellar brake protein YcgR